MHMTRQMKIESPLTNRLYYCHNLFSHFFVLSYLFLNESESKCILLYALVAANGRGSGPPRGQESAPFTEVKDRSLVSKDES
jgi:hypothetical protein